MFNRDSQRGGGWMWNGDRGRWFSWRWDETSAFLGGVLAINVMGEVGDVIFAKLVVCMSMNKVSCEGTRI